MNTRLFSNRWAVAGILVVTAVALRVFTLFPSVINHDESTYIVIADAILRGDVYWIDVIDTKPIGVFLLYAGFQKVFGSAIWILRVIPSIVIGLTGFFLYAGMRKLDGRPRVAFASGLIFVLLNVIYTHYGVSPNTETYFVFFSAVAFWLLVSYDRWLTVTLAGLLLGFGFLIKYVVLFDALTLGVFWLILQRNGGVSWWKVLRNGFSMAMAFSLPFLGVLSWYASSGYLQEFFFYTFSVSGEYPQEAGVLSYLVFVFDFYGRFLPVTLFFWFAFRHQETPREVKYLGVFWSVMCWAIILVPGTFFGHYTIQLMLPFSLLAGAFFGLEPGTLPAWLRGIMRPQFGYALLATVLLVNMFFQKADYWDKPDWPERMAVYLDGRMKPADDIYTGNSAQILYHLLDRTSPIPYIHPTLLWEAKHVEAMKINTAKTVQAVITQSPRFVVINDSVESTELNTFLGKHYRVARRFGRNQHIAIWEKRKQG